MHGAEERRRAPTVLVVGAVFLLFSVWSGSFIAISALLTAEAGPARFDWLSLTVARFVPVAVLCGGYLTLFRRAESAAILGRHWRRVLLSGLLAVPGYNFALCAGQQQAVPAPIASLLTALAPLFLMVLSAIFLGEKITPRRVLGFLLAVCGLVLVAGSRDGESEVAYPLLIAMTALAPLCWSIHSVLTKRVADRVDPLLWTYLAIVLGSLPLFPLLPFVGGPEILALDATGAGLLLYLGLLCTVLGFALWTWLLRQLPATSVGFTIFLNPPLTTAYKRLLSLLFPASIAFSLTLGEAGGGLLMLAGVAVAVLVRPPPGK